MSSPPSRSRERTVSLYSAALCQRQDMKTIITKAIAACAIAVSLVGGAGATVTSEPEEARIPFASNVRDFRADGTDGIYI